jgi:hypothetical protein
MKINLFFIGIVLFSLLFGQCKGCKQDPIPETCEGGYEPVGDDCKCPADKYESSGFCRKLRIGEYYGIASDCYCTDSIFFYLGEPRVSPSSLKLEARVETVSEGTPVYGGEIPYFPLSSGDSITGEPFNDACYINNKPCVKRIFGKKIGEDTLRLKILYVRLTAPEQIIDSCLVYLHK